MAITVTNPTGGGGRSSLNAGEPARKKSGKNTARKSTGGKPPRANGQSSPLLRIQGMSCRQGDWNIFSSISAGELLMTLDATGINHRLYSTGQD